MATWHSHLHRTFGRPCLTAIPSKPYVLFLARSLVRQRLHTAQHKLEMALAAAASASAHSVAWQSLGAAPAELTLDFTLPTGQSFRWRQTGEAEFTGVVDNRVVSCNSCESYSLLQTASPVCCSTSCWSLRGCSCCRSKCSKLPVMCDTRSLPEATVLPLLKMLQSSKTTSICKLAWRSCLNSGLAGMPVTKAYTLTFQVSLASLLAAVWLQHTCSGRLLA